MSEVTGGKASIEADSRARAKETRAPGKSSPEGPWKLYRSLGKYSTLVGIAFIALTGVFLVLSVFYQFIVFEIDSIIAFVAAIVLLFRDPRARVQVGVFDATERSSEQVVRELAATAGAAFRYVPSGAGVDEVVLFPTRHGESGLPNGSPAGGPSLTLTPPGQGLAKLYRREAGENRMDMDSILVTLPAVMSEGFGLARSVKIEENGDRVLVVLDHPSTTCECANYPADPEGVIGCTVASFFAVLVSAATKRPVYLERCEHDPVADAWKVPMRLGTSIPVSA